MEKAKMTVTALTRDNFEAEVLNQEGVYLVRFWAEWCGPCRMMKPMYQSMAEELDAKAGFGEIDIDVAPDLASAYGILSIPTVIVYKNGKPVEKFVGVSPKNNYVTSIHNHLGS
jgi:thioredoxin 1